MSKFLALRYPECIILIWYFLFLYISLSFFCALIWPDVAMEYPRTNIACPQYLFFNSFNLLLRFHIFDTERWDCHDTSICTSSKLTSTDYVDVIGRASLAQLLCIFQQYYCIESYTFSSYRILCEYLQFLAWHWSIRLQIKSELISRFWNKIWKIKQTIIHISMLLYWWWIRNIWS